MLNFVKQTIWSSLINNSSSFITIFGTLLLMRFISPEIFGIYAFLIASREIIAVFFFFRTSQTYLFSKGNETAIKYLIKITFYSSILLLISSIIISFIFYYYDYQNYLLLFIFCVLSILNNFSSLFISFLEKSMNFKSSSLIKATGVNASLLIALIIAYFYRDNIFALIIKELLYSLILIFLTTKLKYFQYIFCRNSEFKKKEFKRLANYSIKSYIPNITEVLSYKIFDIFLSNFAGKNILGLFYQSINLVKLPYKFLGAATENILFVHFKKKKKFNEREFFLIQKIILLLFIPIVFAMNLFSENLINLVLGAAWSEIAKNINYLSLFLLILPLYNSLITILQASNKQNIYTTSNIIVIIIQCFLFFTVSELTLKNICIVFSVSFYFATIFLIYSSYREKLFINDDLYKIFIYLSTFNILFLFLDLSNNLIYYFLIVIIYTIYLINEKNIFLKKKWNQ